MNKQDFVDALSEGQALAAAASAAQCAQNKQVRDALDEMARALGLPTDWVSYDDPPKVDRFGIVHLHRAQSICIDDTPIGVVHPSHNHWVDDGTGKFGPLTELLADMLKRPGAARAVRAAREKSFASMQRRQAHGGHRCSCRPSSPCLRLRPVLRRGCSRRLQVCLTS